MVQLEGKWLRVGGGKMKQAVATLSQSMAGRAGGVAEAVLGAMGAGVGTTAEGGEAESMEDFTRRRIGKAARCKCEGTQWEGGYRRCSVTTCLGWRLRPTDKARYNARQQVGCDGNHCREIKGKPVPCARCPKATHENCRTKEQREHHQKSGQSICGQCVAVNEMAEECVQEGCRAGLSRCQLCGRGVCEEHDVRGAGEQCCMRCLITMLGVTADYTAVKVAQELQSIRNRTSISPTISVSMIPRGRIRGASSRQRELDKCEHYRPGQEGGRPQTYVKPTLRCAEAQQEARQLAGGLLEEEKAQEKEESEPGEDAEPEDVQYIQQLMRRMRKAKEATKEEQMEERRKINSRYRAVLDWRAVPGEASSGTARRLNWISITELDIERISGMLWSLRMRQ